MNPDSHQRVAPPEIPNASRTPLPSPSRIVLAQPVVRYPADEKVTIENDGDIELDTGTGTNAKVLTTADIFVQGSTEGVKAQLESLKSQLQSALDEIATMKNQISSLLSSETDPQVGTVTQEKWCVGTSGGQVECTTDAPLSAIPAGSLHGYCFVDLDEWDMGTCENAYAPALCVSGQCDCEEGYTKVQMMFGGQGAVQALSREIQRWPDTFSCMKD